PATPRLVPMTPPPGRPGPAREPRRAGRDGSRAGRWRGCAPAPGAARPAGPPGPGPGRRRGPCAPPATSAARCPMGRVWPASAGRAGPAPAGEGNCGSPRGRDRRPRRSCGSPTTEGTIATRVVCAGPNFFDGWQRARPLASPPCRDRKSCAGSEAATESGPLALRLEAFHLPPLAIGAADVTGRLPYRGHFQTVGVPFQRRLREPRRQTAEQPRLGQRPRVGERRRGLAVPATRLDELPVVVLAPRVQRLAASELLRRQQYRHGDIWRVQHTLGADV